MPFRALDTSAADGSGDFGPLHEDRRDRVQSVRRACAVLRALATGPVPCSTQVVAERVNLDRTVVRRLLRTLESDGLVSCRKQRWQLGPAAVALGNAYLDTHPLYKTALHHAMVLHDDIGAGRPWVVNAAVPIGTDAVVIARFLTPSAPVETVVKAGTRLPLGGSALGRSMLAFLSDKVRQEILGREGASRFAERADLIRRRGGLDFAVDEIRPGISAIAVAVRSEGQEPIASLAISGPSKLLPLHTDSDLCGRLRRAAARIANEAPQVAPPWRLDEPVRELDLTDPAV